MIKNKTVLLKAFFNLNVIIVKILLMLLLCEVLSVLQTHTTCLEGTRAGAKIFYFEAAFL